jgi:hypothetical protein
MGAIRVTALTIQRDSESHWQENEDPERYINQPVERDVFAKSASLRTRHLPALEYARSELSKLDRQLLSIGCEGPTEQATQKTLTILKTTLDRNSIFPSVSEDGERGIICEWRAGSGRITLEIDAVGRAYLQVLNARGVTVADGDSAAKLGVHLRALSETVTAVNPSWRSLFESE